MKLKHKKEMELKQKVISLKAKSQRHQNTINEQQKGITLIALVITIIVLLILAGVSIATLTGDNGILTKAQIAKDETQEASEEEQRQLAILNASMNTKNYDYPVEDGKVTIPAGFAPTGIEGEKSIEEGLVITDEKGNEFVWIPVENEGEYVRNKNYEAKELSETAYDDEGYLPEGIESETDTVTKAGGFYISRYEAGAEGGKLEETARNEQGEVTNANWKEEPTIVFKKGATIYNWIGEDDAKTKAKAFINSNSVKSALMSGTQWDVLMKFINTKKDGKGNTYNVEEYNKSRHADSLAKAGQNVADKVCNIYDLEGNYLELTAEKVTEPERIIFGQRGGTNYTGIERPASYRAGTRTEKLF